MSLFIEITLLSETENSMSAPPKTSQSIQSDISVQQVSSMKKHLFIFLIIGSNLLIKKCLSARWYRSKKPAETTSAFQVSPRFIYSDVVRAYLKDRSRMLRKRNTTVSSRNPIGRVHHILTRCHTPSCLSTLSSLPGLILLLTPLVIVDATYACSRPMPKEPARSPRNCQK